jgi:DNA-binding MarR family transcriptional regulator
VESIGVQAWAALLRVYAGLVPTLDRELRAATGLPLAWYDVLLEMARAPRHRLLMSELGDRVVLSRTRVSRLVDELVNAEYVQRVAHETDRRATYAVLTAAGRSRQRSAAPVYLAGIKRHFVQHLSAGELSTLVAALERVLAAQPAG